MNCGMLITLFLCAMCCCADQRLHISEGSELLRKIREGEAFSRKRPSKNSIKSYIAFDNRSGDKVKLYYRDKTSKNNTWIFFEELPKEEYMNVDTFVSDRWKATDDKNIRLYMNGKRKIKPNSNKPLTRNLYIISRKRKIDDIHYYIKTLVVVDKSIRNHFGSVFKTRRHVKTLMKSAAKHYLHESLTRYHLRIHLVLSKIVLLKKEIKFDPSKEGILDYACSIMNRIEKRRKRRFDHKLFLTRNEFGSGGLGRGNGMCHQNQSCSMARDDYSSVIIAHEIAHTFGVNHDKYFENSQEIMSPELNNNIRDPHWSIQSRNSLIRRARRYDCIDKTKTSKRWYYNNGGLSI